MTAIRGADGIHRELGADDTLLSESRDVERPCPRPCPRPCDAPGCTSEPVYYCGCPRCDSEPADGAFFCCAAHRDAAEEKHRRIYPRSRAKWYVGTEADRALYLAP